MDKTGRHVLVTGAGSGIGAAIARRFAAAGDRVTLAGRTPAKLEAVAADCPNAATVAMDVSDPESVSRALEEATARFGPVLVLVNNAGIAPTAPFEKTTRTLVRETMAVNLEGALLLTQAVLPGMREAGFGRIVNIASTAGLKAYRYCAAYAASKHALIGLTRVLALETADQGITANAVCPGFTRTPLVEQAIERIVDRTGKAVEEVLEAYTADNPQGRLIEPDEVADLVFYLASAAARGITGQALVLAGGEVMA
ncbi:MAG: SDR family oxidoreductase [Alphaproteobacteria bacterium]|nr:MAG: SDR family oxidoreductase [Alphaproteobacteria bacterium]